MKRLALLFLLLTSMLHGQESQLSIKGDGVKVVKVDRVIVVKEDATVVQSFPFSVHAQQGAGLYFWTAPGMVFEDRGDSLNITNAAKGQATVSVKSILPDLDKDGKFKGFLTKFYSISFNVGDVPTPTPTPTPVPIPVPIPDPVPSPAPIQLPGLRVLMIYEESIGEKSALKVNNPDQYWALFGGDYRDWFHQYTVKGTDGKTPELRIWDKDAVTTHAEKHWRDVFERNKTKGIPYMVISNHPRGGWEGLMPKTDKEIKNLLESYK